MFDTVIKGGTVVDGTGQPAYRADVAVVNGLIAEIGNLSSPARQTIDADGLLVAPGWVDIHTHYDAQVTWDPLLTPSFWHGVTTAVMGNCGVGFAPCAPDQRSWVVGLMEGVEDIPGAALLAGLDWQWETFPEYLDALEPMPRAIDVAAQIPHGPVRAYVMGDRAHEKEATSDDIAAQAGIVRAALDAGAIGFSTSRSLLHIDVDGEFVPGTFAGEDELRALAQSVVDAGHGVFELTVRGMSGSDAEGPMQELAWMTRVSAQTGCPITFLLGQSHEYPEVWREVIAGCEAAQADGAALYPQVFGRPTNYLFSFRGMNPFSRYPTFLALADLPPDERIARLRQPEIRANLLSEEDPNRDAMRNIMAKCWEGTYVLGDPVEYEPEPANSIAEAARRAGKDPRELGYDLMLERDGSAILYFTAFNYADGNLEAVREMLLHPQSVLGGGDGGAHVGYICDASVPTFMLTHWVRDRTRGDRLPLEWVVKKQTLDNANLYGLSDRGALRPGLRADINLIDQDGLEIGLPFFADDLPGGATRLLQKAKGYAATFVAGTMVQQNGEETGARPGRLVRGRAA